jgi:DNA polymerase-3 subunit gamma/tau
MSYLALARKWRPATFEQVVGQQHVLSAISNALDNNKLHHAYLFSGTRGVGKTTIGRIFAKGLNCETGVTGHPCGVCATCKEIDEGRFVDLLEIDAASRTKVEDTRELLDNVQYKPARGRYKVYLIDEVHMLSRHSFNALLKTLEEPPEYVKFLLATTDPQKLPVTILSRCLQFHLKPHHLEDISGQLEHILTQEGVNFELKALHQLAHAGDGSMRDALSLTDQAIALGNGVVDQHTVHSMLGTIDSNYALQLVRAVALSEVKPLFEALDHVASLGADWDVLLKQMAEHFHKIAMLQVLPTALDSNEPETVILSALAKQIQPETIQLYYEITIKGRQSLPLAPLPKQGVEMVLLRLLAFKPKPKQTYDLSISSNELSVPQGSVPTVSVSAEPSVNNTNSEAVRSTKQVDTTAVSKPEQPLQKEPVSPTNTVEAAKSAKPVLPGLEPAKQPTQQMLESQPEYPSEDEYQPMSYDDFAEAAPATSQPSPAPTNAAPRSALDAVRQAVTKAPVTPTQTEERGNQRVGDATKGSALGGLRHQLRSKRMQISQQTDSGAASTKKSGKLDNKASVFDRLAEKSSASPAGSLAAASSPSAASPQPRSSNEPYQWQPSEAAKQKQKQTHNSEQLTPAQLKQALQHERTPEMSAKLQQEALQQDEWATLISALTIPKMVEQLALNSFCEQQGTNYKLWLRPTQAHLNSDKAIEMLSGALSEKTGTFCQVQVEIGEQGQTPLELKDGLYQQKLTHAYQALQQDQNIQFLQTRFGAELDSDTVRPI